MHLEFRAVAALFSRIFLMHTCSLEFFIARNLISRLAAFSRCVYANFCQPRARKVSRRRRRVLKRIPVSMIPEKMRCATPCCFSIAAFLLLPCRSRSCPLFAHVDIRFRLQQEML